MRADRLKRGDTRNGMVFWQSSRKGTPLFVTPEEFEVRQEQKRIGRKLSAIRVIERLIYWQRLQRDLTTAVRQDLIDYGTIQLMATNKLI